MCYPAEIGRSRSNGTSVIREIRLKNFTLSRSLKVIGTDTYRSAMRFRGLTVLVIHHWLLTHTTTRCFFKEKHRHEKVKNCTCWRTHRLRIRILRILKYPKIHGFLRILKLNFKIHKIQIITFIAAKFQRTLCCKHST